MDGIIASMAPAQSDPADALSAQLAETEEREAELMEQPAHDAECRAGRKYYSDQRAAIARRDGGQWLGI